jgi:N-dimethylarginine dimethylaminohydrolase
LKQFLMSFSTPNNLRAAQQWSNLRNVLVSVGADVVHIKTTKKLLPCFTANFGLIYKSLFIPSRFKTDRSDDESLIKSWFKRHKFDIADIGHPGDRESTSFEGASDALFDNRLLVLWYGTGNQSSYLFKDVLDMEFKDTGYLPIALTLTSDLLPYLDSCLCPLESGGCLWYPEAFDQKSQNIIDTWYGDAAIRVSSQDAHSLACNSISIKQMLVTPLISESLTDALNRKGITVIPIDMSQYISSGGACRSLVLEAVS